MEPRLIKGLSDYINALFIIDKRVKDSRKNNPFPFELLFRGQSDTEYKLVPALGRYGSGREDIFFVERNMIDTAKRRFPSVFSSDLDPIELLSTLQHYGVPTRLLDVTSNALVALYFACEGNEKKNGEVFIFCNDTFDVHEYPFDKAIAESYLFARASSCDLEDFFDHVVHQPYFAEQKEMIKESWESGGRWIAECCQKPVFVYGSNRLMRQFIQQGKYILFPNKVVGYEGNQVGKFCSRIEPLSKTDACIVGKIEIPAGIKAEILKELKVLGISRDMLFADNPDCVCQEIKTQFFKEPTDNLFNFPLY